MSILKQLLHLFSRTTSRPRSPRSAGVSGEVSWPPLETHPHRALSSRAAQWGFVFWLTLILSLGTMVGLGKVSHAAQPCSLSEFQPGVLQAAMADLARPPRQHDEALWRRLGALLPRRVNWGLRDLRSDGAGWYQAVGGNTSERGIWGKSGGWSLKLVWDLRPLWTSGRLKEGGRLHDPLIRAERLQKVASRLASRLQALAKLRQRALGLFDNEQACAELRAAAAPLAMVIRATLQTARSRR